MVAHRDGKFNPRKQMMIKTFSYMIIFIIIWVSGGITFLSLFPNVHLSWVMVFGFILGNIAGMTSDIISSFIAEKASK